MSTPAEIVDVGLFGSMDRYGDLGIHGVFDLRRSFSREDLERAARASIAAFPVLDCVYEPHFWKDLWVPARDPIESVVHVLAPGTDVEAVTRHWTSRPVDPTRERAFRAVLLPREEGSRLIVSLSHLAVDGAGMAAVGHVFGSALYGQEPAIAVEPRRDLRPALGRLSWRHLPVLARDAVTVALTPIRTLAAGRRERHFPPSDDHEPTVRHLVIEADELAAIRGRTSPPASVNDVLVAGLARVSAQRTRTGPVAVVYTMDLRRFAREPHLSAANASSILTALLPREGVGDLRTTLETVSAVTRSHRSSLVGPAFVLLPTVLSALTPHGVLRRMMPLIHTLAVDMPVRRALTVTNVGRVDAGLGPFGDDIEALRIIGPNMRNIPTPAVVAFGLRGRLHLELFAPPGLGQAALAELEAELRDALELPRRG